MSSPVESHQPSPPFGTEPEALLRVLASSRNLYAPDMESRKGEGGGGVNFADVTPVTLLRQEHR